SQRADPDLQLPGEPHRRSPDQLQGTQPRPSSRRGHGRVVRRVGRRRHAIAAAASMTARTSARLRREIEHAAAALTEAGVASPRADAEELAAYAADTSRGRLLLIDDVDDTFCRQYADLIAARARRIPLQHIVGTAPLGPVTVSVGPGVFIPRPETEGLLEWASAQPLPPRPVL